MTTGEAGGVGIQGEMPAGGMHTIVIQDETSVYHFAIVYGGIFRV